MLHILKTSRFHTAEVKAASFCNFRDTYVTRCLFYCSELATVQHLIRPQRGLKQTAYVCVCVYIYIYIYIYILPHKVRQTSGSLYLLSVWVPGVAQ